MCLAHGVLHFAGLIQRKAIPAKDKSWHTSMLQVKFVKSGSVAIVRIKVEKPICAELFENVPQLGRFTLRDEGRTIAIGKITKLPKSLKEAE
jgi:peptide chain release factor subunit 3